MMIQRWAIGGATLVALSATLSGCGDDRVVRIDEGKLCVSSSAPDLPLRSAPEPTSPVETPVHVSVSLGCVSACVQNEQAACTVTRHRDELRVHSVHAYDPPDPHQGCIALCGTVRATCVSEPLPSGEYTIRHGDRSYPLAVPAAAERSCY